MRLAVLGSGKGSNFQALLEAGFQITLVISDREEAGILEKARAAGIETAVEKTSVRISLRLLDARIDLVCLAGFMRLVKEPLLSTFEKRILNIHPSLLPKHPGKAAWKQALSDGVSETGCTVHYVDEGMDTGEIILQAKVPVLSDDTPETLHSRIQAEERHLYPEAVRKIISTNSLKSQT